MPKARKGNLFPSLRVNVSLAIEDLSVCGRLGTGRER